MGCCWREEGTVWGTPLLTDTHLHKHYYILRNAVGNNNFFHTRYISTHSVLVGILTLIRSVFAMYLLAYSYLVISTCSVLVSVLTDTYL